MPSLRSSDGPRSPSLRRSIDDPVLVFNDRVAGVWAGPGPVNTARPMIADQTGGTWHPSAALVDLIVILERARVEGSQWSGTGKPVTYHRFAVVLDSPLVLHRARCWYPTEAGTVEPVVFFDGADPAQAAGQLARWALR